MLKKPPTTKPTTTHLGLRIDEGLKARIKRLAVAAGLSTSEAVIQFLTAAVAREEAQAKR